MRKTLTEDLEAMEEVMARTADRADIWQDRLIYAMARAIYHLLTWAVREDRRRNGGL
jgi:hypothetical protein